MTNTTGFRPLALAFRDAALAENAAKRTGAMRRFVYLATASKPKLGEFERIFDRFVIFLILSLSLSLSLSPSLSISLSLSLSFSLSLSLSLSLFLSLFFPVFSCLFFVSLLLCASFFSYLFAFCRSVAHCVGQIRSGGAAAPARGLWYAPVRRSSFD